MSSPPQLFVMEVRDVGMAKKSQICYIHVHHYGNIDTPPHLYFFFFSPSKTVVWCNRPLLLAESGLGTHVFQNGSAGMLIIRQHVALIDVPKDLSNTFWLLRRGQPLYKGQSTSVYIGFQSVLFRPLYCICIGKCIQGTVNVKLCVITISLLRRCVQHPFS